MVVLIFQATDIDGIESRKKIGFAGDDSTVYSMVVYCDICSILLDKFSAICQHHNTLIRPS